MTRHVPLRTAVVVGALSELVYRALRLKSEPLMTRFLAEQLATAHWFDIGAAKRDFGYEPRVSIDEGMDRLRVYLRGGSERWVLAFRALPFEGNTVARDGIEPPTRGFSIPCSTN